VTAQPTWTCGRRDRSGSARRRRALAEATTRPPDLVLITEVWGPVGAEDSSSLRFYLNRLRRKLEPDPSRPRYLRTEPGLGYRFEP
jgi:two-component system KDP operon response regulator KdpE